MRCGTVTSASFAFPDSPTACAIPQHPPVDRHTPHQRATMSVKEGKGAKVITTCSCARAFARCAMCLPVVACQHCGLPPQRVAAPRISAKITPHDLPIYLQQVERCLPRATARERACLRRKYFLLRVDHSVARQPGTRALTSRGHPDAPAAARRSSSRPSRRATRTSRNSYRRCRRCSTPPCPSSRRTPSTCPS